MLNEGNGSARSGGLPILSSSPGPRSRAPSPEHRLRAEARRCVEAVLVATGGVPAGAMVSWPCFGLSVSRASDDPAGAVLLSLRVRGSGAVIQFDGPRIRELRTWGALGPLHRKASEIATRIEGAVDLARWGGPGDP